jgi:DNA-binding NarL/FixJ family response regulator
MNKTNVILIEDHEIFRLYFSKFVENIRGCQIVAVAKGGNDAIEVIKTTPADLIMLDWRLPDLCGLEVLKRSKMISSAKILVITISVGQEIVPQAFDAGADGICRKDIGLNLMETAIRETLDGKKPVYF